MKQKSSLVQKTSDHDCMIWTIFYGIWSTFWSFFQSISFSIRLMGKFRSLARGHHPRSPDYRLCISNYCILPRLSRYQDWWSYCQHCMIPEDFPFLQHRFFSFASKLLHYYNRYEDSTYFLKFLVWRTLIIRDQHWFNE